MSRRLLNLSIIAPATLVSAATATASLLDSSAFAYKYEADDFPTNATPTWSVENSRFASNSLSGGVYSQTTLPDPRTGSLSFAMPDGANWDVQDGVGYAVEMRIRIINAAAGTDDRNGVWFDVGDGVNNAGIRILDSDIRQTSLDGQNRFTTPAANQNNWQVYRLVVSDDHATFDVYLNDALLLNDLSTYTYSVALDRLRWGDPSSAAGTTDNAFDIDYIRWDTTGAYEPIPEPAALGLLTIGAAALVTRRWRRL